MKTARWTAIMMLMLLVACGGADVGALPSPTIVVPTSTTEPLAPPPTLVPTPEATPTEPLSPSPTTEELATTATPEGEVAVRDDLVGKIAFVRGTDLWLYRPQTGEARQIQADTTDARWSPDGSRLAFARSDGLYLADGAGANEQRVHAAERLNTPVWSPDGSRLAFEIGTLADDAASREIWVFELATNVARKVAQGADPAWAPDSKRIAYVNVVSPDGFRRNELRLVSWEGKNDWAVVTDLPPNLPPIGVPGSEPERIGLEHAMSEPVWDAEGAFIYVPSFVIYQTLTDFFIWERVDATNGGSIFIDEVPGASTTLAPDRQVALISANSARGDTWFEPRVLGEADGAWDWAETPRGLTALAPAWAPDSMAVAYYRCELEAPEQCSLQVLTPAGEDTVVPDVFEGQAPKYDLPLTLSWARDG